jgi:DNA-binding transcriptional LysR family regulator
MTPSQFEALAELLQLRQGPACKAARLVLVDGVSPSAAAEQLCISRSAVSNALARCRRGLQLAERATGQVAA